MVGPGGAILDGGDGLGGDASPLGDLGLAEAELAPALGEESAGAVKLRQDVGQGLVSPGVEYGLFIEPGLAFHEHGGRAGAGCGAATHHA